LKFTIITVCYNAEKTIEQTILSVINQKYSLIEYIIIDGGSSDNTLNIISKYSNSINKIISEKDNGIYDALNKGIKNSTGDIIGILNADDEFFDNSIIEKIAKSFLLNSTIDSIIGDIVFQNNSNKTIRYYSSRKWSVNKFSWGFMPPHPSFYCKRVCFDKYGKYLTDFKIAADFELLIRFLKIHKVSFKYLPIIMVKMKLGGASTSGFSSLLTINKEIYRACNLNGIKTNYLKLYSKYFLKIFEYFNF